MARETRPFDAAEYLVTAEDQADLLADAIGSGEPAYIAYALGAVARARGGIAALAEETGLTRQALNKALSKNGNPTLATIMKVVEALGLKLTIQAKETEAA